MAMNISLFDVIGPVMAGPSSSHTAGAVRLARVARKLATEPFHHVSFGLHGSFAKTYKGHGTDRALVAGALGLWEDDERIADAFHIAQTRGLNFDFYETELEGMHENSVVMKFSLISGGSCQVVGSSIGGAQILLREIDGVKIESSAILPTLFISQIDQRGIVSEVSRILATLGLNIGIMKLTRRGKGDLAFCMIETDDQISSSVVDRICAVSGVMSVRAINPETREE